MLATYPLWVPWLQTKACERLARKAMIQSADLSVVDPFVVTPIEVGAPFALGLRVRRTKDDHSGFPSLHGTKPTAFLSLVQLLQAKKRGTTKGKSGCLSQGRQEWPSPLGRLGRPFRARGCRGRWTQGVVRRPAHLPWAGMPRPFSPVGRKHLGVSRGIG